MLGLLLVPLESTASPADHASCAHVDRIVVVRISEARYPKTADHIDDAIRAGQPRRLTLDRRGAAQRREDALKGIPTRRGYDRDEYPPAESRQGGEGADVRYVPSADNRGAGASQGNQLRPYCNGQRFRIATPQR